MLALLEKRRSTSEHHLWAEIVNNINQFNLTAVLRQVLKLPPAKSMENCSMGMSVLRMSIRLQVRTKFKQKWDCVHSRFGGVIVKSLTNFKAEDMTSAMWWNSHEDIARLFVPAADVRKVLNCETDRASVRAEVLAVHKSNEFGCYMMAKPVNHLEVETVCVEVARNLDCLAAMTNITKQGVEDLKKDFVAALRGDVHRCL